MASKSTISLAQRSSVADFIGIKADQLEDMFVCESWSADLATGIVWIGPQTAAFHGVAGQTCGILDIIQPYDPADWHKILLALEEAATVATDISFGTSIRPMAGLYRPVFCFGHSEITATGGAIVGTFATARRCLETTVNMPALLN